MLRIAICDDDVELCSKIESELSVLGKKYAKRIDIGIFYSGESMLKYLSDQEQFDIIFLDIELGEMRGIQVAEAIREEMKDEAVQIIYISARESYAMELFDTRPMNFLVKPIQQERLEQVFLKACQLVQEGEEYFIYGLNQKSYRQAIKDIIFFECIEKKVRMVLQSQEVSFYSRIKLVESQVCSLGFIKIHKSYIVNPKHIIKHEYNQVTMSNGIVLPIAQSNRSKMRKLVFDIRKGQII